MPPDEVSELAVAANQRACECLDERRFVEAIPHAIQATTHDPDWSAPWHNLVVAYKHAGRWPELLAAAERVQRLTDGVDEGTWWNVAIAATALGDWMRARAAWTAAGVRLPEGVGPLDMRIGPTPIRVACDDAPEIVWCDRIDPCRARIRSIPLPETDRGYDDLVLHDGEPRGERRRGDQTLSVFDELAVLERSEFATWEALVREEDVAAALALFDERRIVVEDWTVSLEILCKSCSLGLPHERHDRAPVAGAEHRLALAVLDERELAPVRARPGVQALRRLR